MNSTHHDIFARADSPLPEPDITREIDTVLRAMIVLVAILMASVLISVAIKSLAP